MNTLMTFLEEKIALTSVSSLTADFPTQTQDVTYTSFGKVKTITQGDYVAVFSYNPSNERAKMVIKKNGAVVRTKYYYGNNYEVEIANNQKTEYIWLGGDAYTAKAVAVITNGGTPVIYSIMRDNIGSLLRLQNGSTTRNYSFDAWGRRRDADTWSYTLTGEPPLMASRGFTGHEHIEEFGLTNMNGRLYDPFVGRFLSPDNYVQNPSNSQNFNRYSYCLNNPLRYNDPSGDLVITGAVALTIAISAYIGAYSGYKVAEAKGYDTNNWQTFGYMYGGAVIGTLSGYSGATIAAGGGFMANTLSIASSSTINSVGMSVLSGGMIQPSVSFGAGSYNFGTGDFRSIFDWENLSTMEKIGYSFGSLANIQDLVALNMGTNVDYNAMKHPTGHGSLTNKDLSVNISKGFEPGETSIGKGNIFTYGKAKPWGTAKNVFKLPINNVNKNLLKWMTDNTRLFDKDLLGLFDANYSIWGNTCTSQVARSLCFSGVLGVNPFTIHPMSLYLQLMIRQNGISSSAYLYQIPE